MRQVLGSFLLLIFSAAQAAPISLDWSGTIAEVFEDLGTTSFSGTTVGATVSGTFVYDSQPGAVINEPPPGQACDSTLCEWEYSGPPYGGTANGLSVSGSNLLIENDQDLTENPGDLDLFNAILEPDIQVDTPFDIWELSSQRLLAADDQVEIVVTWITTDTATIADATQFLAAPPFDAAPAAGRAIAFFIQEITPTGSYEAYGIIESTAVIPLPAAVWLFASALLPLVWRRRQHGNLCIEK